MMRGVWAVALGTVGACAPDAPPVLGSTGPIAIVAAAAPAPVGLETAALYFTIRNDGRVADRLIAVHVDRADSATVHAVRERDGAVRMEPLDALPIPAGETVRLAPGGDHVMLTGLHPYAAGDTLTVEVVFERAGRARFSVPVVPYASLDSYMAPASTPQRP